MRLPEDLRLYLVVGEGDCAGRPLEEVVAAAVAGGVTAVQLREKGMPSDALAATGRRLKRLLVPAGVPLIVNDDLEAALACQADALHLGQEDRPAAEARRRLPPGCRLGLSITGPQDLPTARAGIVDHLGIGPVFATATKPDAAPALGLEGLAALRRSLAAFPAVAIGGISAANARQVMECGVDGLAVVSAIAGAADPQAAARALRATVDSVLASRTAAG